MALALRFSAADQASVRGSIEKAPVSLLEALSFVEIHLEVGSSSSLAWVLVFMSVLIVVLLCILVVSDARHYSPFEIQEPGQAQYRFDRNVKQAPQPVRVTGRGTDRPVPAGVGSGVFEGTRRNSPRPEPPERNKPPAQYGTVGSQPAQQPVVAFRPTPAESPNAPAVRAPPQLCPELVLDSDETILAIPYQRLVEGATSFAVLGFTGNTLLKVTIKEDGNMRTIEVTLGMGEKKPRASIHTVPGTGLQVRGMNNVHFGWLQSGPHGGYILTADNMELLSMFIEGESYKFYAPGDRIAAEATNNSNFLGEGPHLQVTVYPQVDAVLVTCCVLAAAVFGGGTALPLP